MNIAYGILNMGMGHATRSLPIVRELIKRGHTVHLFSTGRSLSFLKNELSESDNLHLYDLPDYGFTYSRVLPAFLSVMLQTPKFILNYYKELSRFHSWLQDQSIDVIISDHRYGFYGKGIPSFFITHQLALRPPLNQSFLRSVGFKLHSRMLKKFDRIIVPDVEGDMNLSGDLSHHLPGHNLSITYAGPLLHTKPVEPARESRPIVAVVSGPEPQRTYLEQIFTEILPDCSFPSICFLGKPESSGDKTAGNCRIVDFGSREMILAYMQSAQLIISRSGYTTLMELAWLGKKAILIPTPGQTEQEYLAEVWQKNGLGIALNQKNAPKKLLSIIEEHIHSKPTNQIRFDPESNIHNLVDTIELIEMKEAKP
ncbi:MAG: glycosyltransferase [Calditrichia bacterium]